MATIKDVAKVAGVTVTTVSRVLNDRGYISQATREKVYDAMKKLDYQPNELARSLFRKRTNIFGLIIPDVSHPFFGELTKYVEFFAYKYGYKILICNSYEDSLKEREYIDMLKRNQVDGIIMASNTLETVEYLSTNLPIVAIDRNLSPSIPFISSDNYSGGMLATKLLIDRGCKKIAHISGPLELNTPANKRYQAFIDCVSEKNVDYVIKQAKLDIFESYEKLAENLFFENPDIDGVFASSDMIGASIIRVAKELRKDIPKELKIVGYDDIKLSHLLAPPLTTIRQPIDSIGEMAIKILINQLEGKEVSFENYLPVELILRETT